MPTTGWREAAKKHRLESRRTLAVRSVEHFRTGSMVFVLPTGVDVERQTDRDRLNEVVKDHDDEASFLGDKEQVGFFQMLLVDLQEPIAAAWSS